MTAKRWLYAALGAGIAAAVGWLAPSIASRETAAQEQDKGLKAKAKPDAGPRPADRDAVTKALDKFAAAFQKADAKALAACWTADGEYVSDDGDTYRGRAALEKAYAEYFTKNPDNKLAVEVESVRFPSRDTAVVEGHFKVRRGKAGELVVSKCSLLLAQEDGAWLVAIAREWPADGLTLRDLEWLIGTWESNKGEVAVRTTYEWTANKAFIRCRFSVAQGGQTHTGMQMFGKDPGTGALRVWTFEDDGGIGETEIARDGKKWIFSASGATADGREVASTNIMTPVDADSFLWHAVERSLDDRAQPDLPPVKVTRVKDKP